MLILFVSLFLGNRGKGVDPVKPQRSLLRSRVSAAGTVRCEGRLAVDLHGPWRHQYFCVRSCSAGSNALHQVLQPAELVPPDSWEPLGRMLHFNQPDLGDRRFSVS